MENESLAVKKIVKVWNEDGIIDKNINFLLNKTKKITFPLTPNSKQIIQDLHDAYREIPCAGIAANQIGYDKSIFIGLKKYDDTIDPEEIEEKESNYEEEQEGNEYADNFEVYINPRIDKVDNQSIQSEVEGCLSIPLLSLRIERYDKIKVRYYDQNGKAIKRTLKGFMSKLFQHELDHLNGLLMLQANIVEGFAQEESFVTPELYNELQSKISS